MQDEHQQGKKGGAVHGIGKTAAAAAAGAILGGVVGAVAAHPKARKQVLHTVSQLKSKAEDVIKKTNDAIDEMQGNVSDTAEETLQEGKEKISKRVM
jgi:hypothetical protein